MSDVDEAPAPLVYEISEKQAQVRRRAEMAVLGAAMHSQAAAATIVADLHADDFAEPDHRQIWQAIDRLMNAGTTPGSLAVTDELVRAKSRIDLGLLIACSEAAPPVRDHIAHPLSVVKREAERRRFIEAGTRMAQIGRGPDFEPADAIARGQADLDLVHRIGTDGPVHAGEHVVTLLERYEDTTPDEHPGDVGLTTGFRDLDHVLNRMRAGQLLTVGARPAVGKSVFALNIAWNVAHEQRQPVVLFTLEMSRTEVLERLIAAAARVSLHMLQNRQLDDHAWQRIATALPDLTAAPLYVDDTADLTLAQLRARARQSRQRHGVQLVLVDYLQLLTPSSRRENRQADVAEMSRGLKLAAKQLEVPVVVLSQLNRAVEQRQSKRPVLSDLRESGAVEQDSDVVLLLARDPSAPAGSPESEEAEVIVAKQRNGPTGDVKLGWQGFYARFTDQRTWAPQTPLAPFTDDADATTAWQLDTGEA